MKKKRKWVTPKLLILVRGRPEESVLMACKMGWGTVMPTGQETPAGSGCKWAPPFTWCGATVLCNVNSAS